MNESDQMSLANFVSGNSPLSSQLYLWRVSRSDSPRTHNAPSSAVHLHEHVPVHVPSRQ